MSVEPSLARHPCDTTETEYDVRGVYFFGVVPHGPHCANCLHRSLPAREHRNQRRADGAFRSARQARRHQQARGPHRYQSALLCPERLGDIRPRPCRRQGGSQACRAQTDLVILGTTSPDWNRRTPDASSSRSCIISASVIEPCTDAIKLLFCLSIEARIPVSYDATGAFARILITV